MHIRFHWKNDHCIATRSNMDRLTCCKPDWYAAFCTTQTTLKTTILQIAYFRPTFPGKTVDSQKCQNVLAFVHFLKILIHGPPLQSRGLRFWRLVCEVESQTFLLWVMFDNRQNSVNSDNVTDEFCQFCQCNGRFCHWQKRPLHRLSMTEASVTLSVGDSEGACHDMSDSGSPAKYKNRRPLGI